MNTTRKSLPQLSRDLFLTDGGIETTLIFHEGLDLPDFAAFHLLKDAAGTEALRKYFRTYADLAQRLGVGYVLESATWRANPDWGARLGYSIEALAAANRKAIALLEEIRADYRGAIGAMVISGCVGPRGDGYQPSALMSADQAARYHAFQAGVFREAGVDMVTAITMNYAEEAIGVTRAARSAGLPVAIAFTVETDGRLPTGQTLGDAIGQVDREADGGADYYMINCAHPIHFESALAPGEPWLDRIRGLRANASSKSHAELNESPEIDMGDIQDLGRRHDALLGRLRNVSVLGGCCGTDQRHVEEILRVALGRRSRETVRG